MRGSSGDKARVIQTLLFVAGINTLLQALFGTRLRAVVGGSFAYVIPVAYIIGDSSLQRINDPHEALHHFIYKDALIEDEEFFMSGSSFLPSISETFAAKLLAAAEKYDLPRHLKKQQEREVAALTKKSDSDAQ
ncbi:unnamed protein product [Lathyrus sativus]|nr:unnamed protein product [Lathyrus sativus]